MSEWYQLETSEVLEKLQTDSQDGLSDEEARLRLEQYGPNELVEKGVIRRFGATLRHQEAGYSSNAMVAWIVPDDKIEDIGEMMADFREVTHCYQRRPQNDWQYNLFTMVHGDSKDECYEIAQRMSKISGINEYTLLFSEKEFKKTSMEYF